MQKIISTIRFILFFCCLTALCQSLSKGAETRRFALKTIRIYGNAHLSSQQILNALNITLPTELELNHNLDWNDVFTPELYKRYYPESKSGKIRVALDSVTLMNRVEVLENLYQRKGYFDADLQLTIDIDTMGLGILDVICREGKHYSLTDLLITDTALSKTIPWNCF